MIKQSAALIVCTLFFLMTTPHFAQSSPMLEFVGTPTTIGINDTFSLDVVLTGMEDPDSLSTFDFNINFDPTILAISGYTFGDGLSDPFAFLPNIQSAAGLDTGAANFSDTTWSMDFSFFADQFDGSNSLTLLTLDITALTVGFSDLTISGLILGDGYGWGFDAAIINSSVTVAPVPEPSTLLLVGAGILGLAGIRRKSNSKKR